MDLLVLVPYSEQDLNMLRSAAGDLRIVTLPEDAPDAELRQALETAKIVIGEPPVHLLQDLPNLEWIQMSWAGADRYTKNPDFPRHIKVTTASGVYGVTIAEHLVMMTLEMLRRQVEFAAAAARNEWIKPLPVKSIYGSRVTFAGTGDIGCETAKRIRAFEPAAMYGVNRRGRNPLCSWAYICLTSRLVVPG